MKIQITVYNINGLETYSLIYDEDYCLDSEYDIQYQNNPSYFENKDISLEEAEDLQDHIIEGFMEYDYSRSCDGGSVIYALAEYHNKDKEIRIKSELLSA